MTDQTPITRAELDALIAAAVARTLAMTPEERSAMMEAQRQSWADGEAGLRRDTETSASPPRYPVILNGDHAEFEREHAGTPPHERPDWPLPSFDARDWSAAFLKRNPNCGIDEATMTTWFANALMRGFDERASRTSASPPRVPVSSAQAEEVGVESGPGQPVDIVDRMNAWRTHEARPQLRALLATAEVEIRRLRELADRLRVIEETPQSYYVQGRRAGIEQAAEWHEAESAEHGTNQNVRRAHEHTVYAKRIRALADKPAQKGD